MILLTKYGPFVRMGIISYWFYIIRSMVSFRTRMIRCYLDQTKGNANFKQGAGESGDLSCDVIRNG